MISKSVKFCTFGHCRRGCGFVGRVPRSKLALASVKSIALPGVPRLPGCYLALACPFFATTFVDATGLERFEDLLGEDFFRFCDLKFEVLAAVPVSGVFVDFCTSLSGIVPPLSNFGPSRKLVLYDILGWGVHRAALHTENRAASSRPVLLKCSMRPLWRVGQCLTLGSSIPYPPLMH